MHILKVSFINACYIYELFSIAIGLSWGFILNLAPPHQMNGRLCPEDFISYNKIKEWFNIFESENRIECYQSYNFGSLGCA